MQAYAEPSFSVSVRKPSYLHRLHLAGPLLASAPARRFYEEFKQFLLVGCFEDDANRSKLAKLLRFVSSYTEKQDGKKKTSLEEYVARMQEEQPAIYYMTGEKITEMEREAALEVSG